MEESKKKRWSSLIGPLELGKGGNTLIKGSEVTVVVEKKRRPRKSREEIDHLEVVQASDLIKVTSGS